MKTDRTKSTLAALLAVLVAACGGSSGGGGAFNNSGSSGGSTSTGSGCSLAERQAWVKSVVDEWYLFPDMVDQNVNPAAYSDVQSYLDALVAPARAAKRDKGFSYLTSIAEEEAFFASGATAGFGIRLSYDTAANRVFVTEAFEAGPAFATGMDRGAELLAIGNDAGSLQSIASLMSSGGYQAVSNALGPSDAGVSRYIKFRKADGTEAEGQITKADFSISPLSPRYGTKVFQQGDKKIGYINLRTFIESANPQMRDAFANFQAQGVDEVIIDVRYNGGGLVSVALVMGSLLGKQYSGQEFARLELRQSKANENQTYLFGNEPSAISSMKIAFIGTGGTASASELVPNAFIPYLGDKTALVGSNTYGKPVGQYGFDRAQCDDRLRLVTFRTVNKAGGGDYYNGLASVMPVTCASQDDFTKPLGDASEASVSTALSFLEGQACTPISTASSVSKGKSQGAIGTGGRAMQLLQPDRPSAVQERVPGLF